MIVVAKVALYLVGERYFLDVFLNILLIFSVAMIIFVTTFMGTIKKKLSIWAIP